MTTAERLRGRVSTLSWIAVAGFLAAVPGGLATFVGALHVLPATWDEDDILVAAFVGAVLAGVACGGATVGALVARSSMHRVRHVVTWAACPGFLASVSLAAACLFGVDSLTTAVTLGVVLTAVSGGAGELGLAILAPSRRTRATA